MSLRSNKEAAVRRREELAKTLMPKEEQQRLVVERTMRLLNAGNAPPVPPLTDILQARKGLREEVSHIVDDQVKYEIGSPDRHRDNSELDAQVYALQLSEISRNAGVLDRTAESLGTRVEFRDYLNEEAEKEAALAEAQSTATLSAAADVAITEHIRAAWLLAPPEVIQRADLDRERRLFEDAKAVIVAAPEMRDFAKHHVGEVAKPGTTGSGGGRSEAEAFVEAIRQRDEKARMLREGRAIVAEAAKVAAAAEEKVRLMATALEKRGRSMGFDERVRERKKMMLAKDEADALVVAAEAEKVRFENMRRELGDGGGAGKGFGAGLVDPGPRNLVIWLMGITDGVNIGKCYFGNYSTDDKPPTNYWLPFSEAERETKLSVKYPPGSFNSITGLSITVAGAVDPACGGKFASDGASDDVAKYTNSEGVSLFRARLHETPELGITTVLLSKEAPGLHEDAVRANKRGATGPDKGEGEDDEAARTSKEELRKQEVDVFDLAGEQLDPLSFGPLRGVGLRMIVTALREQVVRRQQHKAEIEKLVEAEFQAEMARAASRLKAVNRAGSVADGGGDDGGGGQKIDYTALMMKAPNTTYMLSDADVVARLPGSDRIIPTGKDSVPPLCGSWVMLSCPNTGQACKRRHYYVNETERLRNSEQRQHKEHALDMDCLLALTTREALLESVKEEAAASQSAYLRDEAADKVEHRHVAGLLSLLDRLRLVSVHCVEAIGRWRDHQEAMRSLGLSSGGSSGDLKGWWAVTVKVTGAELYKASAAFRSKVKRFQRDRQEAVKAVEYHYLGVFPTKSDASRCYDHHIALEAARKGTNPVRHRRRRQPSGSLNQLVHAPRACRVLT